MANENKSSRNTLIVFGGLAGTVLFLFIFTDLSTFFSAQTLTLDATSSQGKASDRGVDASTGHFKGKGFKGQDPPVTCLAIGQCPPSTDIQIIDSRNGISGGGGAPASTVGLEGFQVLVRATNYTVNPNIARGYRLQKPWAN